MVELDGLLLRGGSFQRSVDLSACGAMHRDRADGIDVPYSFDHDCIPLCDVSQLLVHAGENIPESISKAYYHCHVGATDQGADRL